MSLVLWYEGEALVLGVEFGACASESAPFFPALFGFSVFFVVWYGFFEMSLVFWYEGEALVLGVEFGASGSEPCFLRDITLFSRHFWFFGVFHHMVCSRCL